MALKVERYWNYGKVVRLIDCYTSAQLLGGIQAVEEAFQADLDHEKWKTKIILVDEDYTGCLRCKFEVVRSEKSITARLLEFVTI